MERKLLGSYTVEAAFVMPILLGIVFTLLYILMIFHDKTLLQANLNQIMILGVNGDVDIRKYDYETVLSKNLWIMEIETAEISKGIVRYQGEVTAEASVSVPVLSYFMNGRQTVVLEEVYGTLRPECGKRRKEIGGN